MRSRRSRDAFVGLCLLVLIAAACSSGKSSTSGGGSSSTSSSSGVKKGGDLVFGAEQEPDCMDWIGACAGSAWGVYAVQSIVMPKSFDFTDKNTYKPTELLVGEPILTTSPKQVVTYKLNPKAVWNDNVAITCDDYKYTWDQIAHGDKIYDTTGYADITGVDCPDPKTAVVNFDQPFPAWRDLFGGYYGLYPSHLLQGKDRDALTKDGYDFSGGPFELAGGAAGWQKGQQIKLVPNPNYWGKKPNLNSITFRFLADTASEQQAFKSGQIAGAYPQAQPGQDALKGTPNTYFDAVSGLSYEGLYMNAAKAPLDSKNVRQALAYATDRDAIVKQLFAPVQPDIKPIQSFATPAFGDAYSTAFSKYTMDMNMVTQLMTTDGWKKGGDGIWAKGSTKATVELKTTTGNKRRELTAQILQTQWKAAGFGLNIVEEKSGVLFGQDLPAGNFQIGLYAQTPQSNDPGNCVLWCSKNIPGPANKNSGTNFTRTNDPAVDKAWLAADTDFDTAQRAKDAQDGEQALADYMASLPLDPFPDILVFDSSKVGEEGGTIRHNFSFGPWVYAADMYAK